MIDFTFSEQQQMLRQAAREFAESVVAPRIPKMEATRQVDREIIQGLANAEMMALTIPGEYGGLGLGHTARLIALEEIGRVSVATAMMLQVFALGIEPIVLFGTNEQKKRLLPGLATGKRLATVAVTEPSGGSDPSCARTVFVRDGDSYVLNGRKCFITNSHIADTVTVLAKDGAAGESGTFSTFIVEGGMEGFRATHEEHKLGMHGCNTGELVFEDCRVPKENLLGSEGKGMRVAMAAIGMAGRGGMVGCALGLHTACLESALRFSSSRVLYGQPISNLQTIQNKLAEMKIDLEAGRLLGYRATAMQDQGLEASNEFAVAKHFTTEAAQKAAKVAVDIHGGYGCIEEFDVTRYYRDAAALGPSAGTSDIMKVIVARWILKAYKK